MTTIWGEMFLASCVLIPKCCLTPYRTQDGPSKEQLGLKISRAKVGIHCIRQIPSLLEFSGGGWGGTSWILSVYSWDMTAVLKCTQRCHQFGLEK